MWFGSAYDVPKINLYVLPFLLGVQIGDFSHQAYLAQYGSSLFSL
jgi:hypothetical protein